jgi:hypothetical protein
MLAVMLDFMVLDVMLAVILTVMMLVGGKGRACKGHQKQSGGKNLFHGVNIARRQRRR